MNNFGTITLSLQLSRMGQAFLINLSLIPGVLAISFIIGFIIAILRYYKTPFISQALFIICEIIRGAPFLLLVYGVFFILPGIGVSFSPFGTGLFILSITGSVLMGEIFLSGLLSIDKGQYYAADSLGMSFVQKIVYIIIPQMIKLTLPSIIGQIILTIKDTSIVSLVGLAEIVRTARQLSLLTQNAFLSFGIVGLYFFAVCYPLILLSKKLERRLSRGRL
jgi:His/Glu/Gln/Arg/opine family amino acid ABC transporter permease subunit